MPQLEELGISHISINPQDIKVIGQNCPQLKTFMVLAGSLGRTFMMNSDDNAFAIANNMPELTRLKLFDKNMTNIGLKAILEGCPHLESLHIRMCYDLDLDGNLKKVCTEQIKDFKFDLEIEDDYYDDYTLSSRDVDDLSASTSIIEPSSAMEESPNWLAMPHELMTNILKRLGDVEILNTQVKVCTTWWRICKNPAMWKAINIHKPDDADGDADYDFEALTKRAVNLSSGELIDFSIKGFGNDDLLDYIVLRSSKLNSLCLTDCYDITISGLNRALKMVPQLEKLHIICTSLTRQYTEVMVPNCPHLKSFKLDDLDIYVGINTDTDALAIANNMPELRHLVVSSTKMTNNGLKAILDGCPDLESLDIEACYFIRSSGNEVKLCKERIKNFKGPVDLNTRMLQFMGTDDAEDYDAFNFE
ncbi:hypothetical protein LXL04_027575 [Taraxacum kok-saghyz]